MTTTHAAPFPSALTIQLDALAANYRHLKSMTAADVGAAIKANAYGTGILHVFEALLDEGCRDFFVATPDEAQILAARPRAEDAKLYVLGGLYKEAEDFYAEHAIRPVLNTVGDLQRWKNTCTKYAKPLPCAVHIDTGMNRLGLSLREVPDDFGDLAVDFIMSHFSCADEKDHDMNAQQAQAFSRIAQRFPHHKKSLCNSSGIFRSPDWHYDLLRPGYALYGGNPTPETKNPMQPVVFLESRILQIRDVEKGESTGYGAGHVFDTPATIATVAIGYADGLARAGSGRAQFFIDGIACPVVGRVSMDVSMIDITHLKEKPALGSFVEILGRHQDVDTLARACGTIGYEILTSLGPRHRRIYKSG